MSPKSIALLVVGMLLVSSVFFIFHVSYPANPATIKFNHVPKNVQPPKYTIFKNETLNKPGLGLNQTSFTPTGNTSMTLEGYVYNASSPGGKQPIANSILGIAVMQALVLVNTNARGFYQVNILTSGQGTFAYKVFQYHTKTESIYIGQGIKVQYQNVSLTPEQKYSVSGDTQSHSNLIPGVSLTFSSFWGKYYSYSTNTATYSLNMVDGNYSITALKTGFNPVPQPYYVNVSGAPVSNYALNMYSTDQAAFYMNGYVFNQLGNRIPNALVRDVSPPVANGSAITQPNGFYNISVAYYQNTINIGAAGYTTTGYGVTVLHNLTNKNFSLPALDPFNAASADTNITNNEPAGLGNDISSVDYATYTPVSISGEVISTQTGMAVPNQQFTMFTSVNGTYFYDLITTNASGDYQVSFWFHGNYHVNVTSLKFYDTWVNQSLGNSATNIPIYVTTAPSQVYHLTGGVLNGLGNLSLANATITISAPGGGVLTVVNTNATGQFNISLLGGTYNISVSHSGFNSTNITTTITGNVTGLTVPITPTSSIANGSGVWNSGSGSGVPGVNGSSISSQLNSTQNLTGVVPGTNTSTPVTLVMRMLNNATNTSIDNTAYQMFIRVNDMTLNLTGSTNSTGYSYLNLSYGGSYILLPEMVDYTGIATLVNTSQYQGKVLDLYLNPLPTYLVTLNLSNPLSYSGDSVPASGLSITGYSLQINPSNIAGGSNYTVFYYVLPNGTYDYKYSNIHYVTVNNYLVNVSGSDVSRNITLKPYVLQLSWNTASAWSYTLSGPGATGVSQSGNKGNSSAYMPLQNGAYSFSAFLGTNLAGSSLFILNSSSNEHFLTFASTLHNLDYNSSVWNYNGSTGIFDVNAAISQTQTYYISQVSIDANLTSNATMMIDSTQIGNLTGNSSFDITNYFATAASGQTTITITSDGFNDYGALSEFGRHGVNVSITYFTASLTG